MELHFREKVVGGLLWIGGMRFASQIITWSITIIVIRLLSPVDYGLLAMAMVLVGFLGLLAEGGLGQAVVQSEQLDEVNLRRVFGAVIVVNCLLFIFSYAASTLVADFFGEQRLVPIIRVLALQFLIGMFTVIPQALLTRVLDFKRQSMIGLAASVLGSLGTLIFAIQGYGVWALVAGTLASILFNAIALNVIAPYRAWPSFSLIGMRKLLMFGGQLTGARVLWYLYSQADFLIAGKMLGKEALGFYSLSMHLASLPVQKVLAVLNQVTFPAFARSQKSPERIPRYILKAIRLLSLVSIPVLWGISSVAPEIVQVLLGPKWTPAILPLQLLPLIMPLNMLSYFLGTAVQGVGRGDTVLINLLIATIVMPVAFLVGSHWGLLGLSLAWVLVFPIVLIMNLRRTLPQLGLTLSQVAHASGPSVLAGLGMYAGVLGGRYVAAPHLTGPILGITLISIGACIYVLVTLCTNRLAVREALELIHGKAMVGLEAAK